MIFIHSLDSRPLRAHFPPPCRVGSTSAPRARQNGKTKADLSRSLLTRDLWLTVLEATVINHVWVFVTALPVMQVFWAAWHLDRHACGSGQATSAPNARRGGYFRRGAQCV
jgi:hypothetical protein